MSSTLIKIITILLWVLLGVSAVVGILFYAGGIVQDEAVGTAMEQPVYTATLIAWTYFLFYAAIALVAIFAIIGMITNPKGAVRSLIAIGALGVVILIAYGLASDTVFTFSGSDQLDTELTPALFKNVGTGLITTYILGLIAALGIVVSGLMARFR